jgi:hypothetical protein
MALSGELQALQVLPPGNNTVVHKEQKDAWATDSACISLEK